MAGYVLDTSAVMAVLFGENGASLVRETIYGRDRVRIPFVALMEVEYKLLQFKPEVAEESLATIDTWPVFVEESYYTWRREAAHVKASAKLSLADAWVASLALINDAELVQKDPEFDGVAGLKALRLPYDEPQGRSR